MASGRKTGNSRRRGVTHARAPANLIKSSRAPPSGGALATPGETRALFSALSVSFFVRPASARVDFRGSAVVVDSSWAQPWRCFAPRVIRFSILRMS